MSAPYDSSEQAEGLKEGFEGEGISGILKPQLIEPYGGLFGSRQN